MPVEQSTLSSCGECNHTGTRDGRWRANEREHKQAVKLDPCPKCKGVGVMNGSDPAIVFEKE